MKVFLTGKNSQNLIPLINSLGIEIVENNPDVVISYGGDGTLLSAEREYPGIPKLPIRDSQVCKKCSNHKDELVFKKLLNGKLSLNEYRKLHTLIDGEDLYALNDFVVRNLEQTHTIRFKISDSTINSKLLIGDGIVVATPFGSTGYFRSITRESFTQGFAVAFNNTTEEMEPLYFKEDQQLRFTLIRGKVIVSFDNSQDYHHMFEGSTLTFDLSDEVARIYEDSSLRCPDCQIIR